MPAVNKRVALDALEFCGLNRLLRWFQVVYLLSLMHWFVCQFKLVCVSN